MGSVYIRSGTWQARRGQLTDFSTTSHSVDLLLHAVPGSFPGISTLETSLLREKFVVDLHGRLGAGHGHGEKLRACQ